MLLAYGVGAVVAGRSSWRPPAKLRHRPGPAGQEERALMFDGLQQALRNRNFLLLMLIFFIGLGVFNSVTTWIEISSGHALLDHSGGDGGWTDDRRWHYRALTLPALSTATAAGCLSSLLPCSGDTGTGGHYFCASNGLLLVSAFLLGFFLLSSGPIGFQYGAEIARPRPKGRQWSAPSDGTDFGHRLHLRDGQLQGQCDRLDDASLIALIGLMILGLVVATRLRESALLQA